jgi:hypothetical protein
MDLSKADLKKLLESFLSHAVGLHLGSPVDEGMAPRPGGLPSPEGLYAEGVWNTDRGVVWGSAAYHAKFSAKIHAHVLWLEWTIGEEAHRGFFYCYPSRPREWIVGSSRDG